MDDYVLVLEDRTEVKNEAEVGKTFRKFQTSLKRGNSRQLLPKKQPFCPMICVHFVAAFVSNVQE